MRYLYIPRNIFYFILLFSSGLLLQNCGRQKEELLLGTWKIDSVYTFYNGFGRMENTIVDLEQYVYHPGGQLDIVWNGNTKSMQYKLQGSDSLLYLDNNTEISRYFIMKLNNEKLTLRKEKKPIFQGKGQDRYEIRYFSKEL